MVPSFFAKTRITPAHAGKRPVTRRTTRDTRDHPRACGEKMVFSSRATTDLGSPPRMRGKGAHSASGPVGKRITPAHAGKRRHTLMVCRHRRDHPRACGEKGTSPRRWKTAPGSPPRMRGKAHGQGQGIRLIRITPAHAGKSLPNDNNRWVVGDHPRACGEKHSRPWPAPGLLGSPPRMRGKGVNFGPDTRARQDHPRACGEKFSPYLKNICNPGSPPRMRGKGLCH